MDEVIGKDSRIRNAVTAGWAGRISGKLFGFERAWLEEHRRVVNLGLLLAGVAVGLRFFFWWYTGRVWEDALITVLHSENFVQGLGLTHDHVDEPPVHGFTSPLSVLVPLAGDLLKVGFGLSLIKIMSAFAGGLTVLYAMAMAIHPKIRLPAPLVVMVMGYLAVEHHQILWGMAGMETQLVTLVLLASIYYAAAAMPTALGVSLGCCMLARPDFAFWTMAAGFYVLATNRRAFFKVVGIALALYAPWIIFTTLYYGSPIPNTILAKSLGYRMWTQAPNLTWSLAWANIWDRIGGVYGGETIFQTLGPAFGGHGTAFWPIVDDGGLVSIVMTILAVIGSGTAVWRRQWELLPAMLFAGLYTVYYVFFVPHVFGWYVIPLAAVMVMLAARGLQAISELLWAERTRNVALGIVAGAYVGMFACVLPTTFPAEGRIQEVIENNVRKPIGLYLGQLMKKDETVGAECLGYLAYYSRRTVYDWPGLVSRKVVAYSREHPEGRRLGFMLEHFRPDYIVLRRNEYEAYRRRGYRWVEEDYAVLKAFEAAPEEAEKIFLIERNIDREFLVLKKRKSGSG